jgi:hypothetical protein
MTAYFIDSCGSYYSTGTKGGWTSDGISVIGGGPQGQNALRVVQNGSGYKMFPTPLPQGTAAWTGFKFRATVPGDNTPIAVRLCEGTAAIEHIGLRMSGSNLVIARAGTTVATAVYTILASTWYSIDLGFTIADSASVQLWINGVQIIAPTTVDTRNGGTGQIDSWLMSRGNNASIQDICDIYVASTKYGPGRCVALTPNAAGDSTDWTPLSSTNVSNVDETTQPDDDTTYVSSVTAGDIDLYNLTAPTLAGTIKAAGVSARWRKDDAGVRFARTKLKSGSTVVDGTSLSVPDAYVTVGDAFLEEDPDTSAAWTDLSGLQAGVELVS